MFSMIPSDSPNFKSNHPAVNDIIHQGELTATTKRVSTNSNNG